MTISFYNTLTHQVQEFQPLYPAGPDGKKPVYMYNCGPTVYDFAHIGNFRAFVFADVLRRFLELSGYTVYQVMNLTDVGHMTDDANPDGAGVDKMTQAGERLKEAKKSGEFVIPGIGKLVKQKRAARKGHNPKTGASIKIPAKTVVKFRVSKTAKDAILGVKKK